MELRNESAGWAIVKWIIFIILVLAAIRIAFWTLGVITSLVILVIKIAVIALIAYGVYYLLFGTGKSKF